MVAMAWAYFIVKAAAAIFASADVAVKCRATDARIAWTDRYTRMRMKGTEMTAVEHPILFSGPMVRAILDGRKTMTRRIIKLPKWAQECNEDHEFELDGNPPWPHAIARKTGCLAPLDCPYGQTGDRLWVKEAWAQRLDRDHLNGTQLYASGVREAWYWADGPGKCCCTGCAGAAGRLRASRFMPRWASRITLEIIDVRVEQLQEISGEDAKAEGADYYVGGEGPVSESALRMEPGYWHGIEGYRSGFEILWNKINSKRESWASNPFVWVLKFTRLEAAIKE